MKDEFEAVTRTADSQVRVRVAPSYIRDAPVDEGYCFAYTITISNLGESAVRLLSRRWLITDGDNRTQEVRGAGVVGEQPRIAPGENYMYTSHVVLPTPVGTMRGSYEMRRDTAGASGESASGGEGESRFDAEIPLFALRVPGAIN